MARPVPHVIAEYKLNDNETLTCWVPVIAPSPDAVHDARDGAVRGVMEMHANALALEAAHEPDTQG